MRIAIDGRELAGKPTGVGRYLAEILSAWNDLPGAALHDFIFCAPRHMDDGPRVSNLRLVTASASGDGTLWEQISLPRLLRRWNADVLFAPAYSGPVLCPVPMVLTIHDVSFAAHPEWFSWREGTRRRLITRLAARRAVRVLTVSDFSKREITSHLGIDHSKVEVIYSGATLLAGRSTSPLAMRDEAAMVLCVGSIFNRRHVPELIEGFARLARRQPHVRLEIVGDNRSRPTIDLDRIVRAAGMSGRIQIRSYVPDPELMDLYARATAFAFLSEYEGFGMTPLDALAVDVPIVVLDTEVAREIYGPAALYVPSPEPALIEAALDRALFDQHERARLLDAARPMLERYSWRDCAHRTLQVLIASAASEP